MLRFTFRQSLPLTIGVYLQIICI